MANLSNINNRFLVTTGGNVLIGQTAAVGSSILQVTGNATFSDNVFLSSNKYILIGTDSGDAFNSDSAIRIQETGNAYMQIKTGTANQGGVLIGDTDDDYVGGFIYSNNTNTLTFQQNNAAALTISGSQNATFTGDITVSGGDITLGGTGRIQGVDTVSASTDAANKAYVDAHPGSGGTVTSVATGNGISGGTITTSGTLTVGAGNGLSQSSTGLLMSGSYTGNFSVSGSITTNGSGAGGYLYVAGNAASAAPTNTQGMAFAYNNSGGSRENELFFNPGIVTPAQNATYYFAIINEYLNSSSGNARTTDTLVKLYGDGNLELVGPTSTSTIANTFWRMPKSAAPNTGYYLSKSAGSIDLQWTAPPSGGSGTVTSVATGNGLTGGTITTTGTLTMSGSYTGNFAATSVQPGGSGQGILSAGNVDRNLKYTGGSSTDGGFTGFNNAGGHLWQLYGSGSNYGFLDGNWGAWDLMKTKTGNLYMNNNTTYYLNTTSNSFLAGNLSVGLVNTSYGIFCSSAISGTNMYANSSGGSFVFGASTTEGEYIQRPGGSDDICLIAGGSIGINTTTPSSYSNGSIGAGNTSLVIAGGGNQGITISGSSSAKIVLSKNTTPECFIQSDVNNAGTMEFFTNGTGATRTLKLLPTGQVKFDQYGSGSYTGTAAYNLSVDSSGNMIETSGSGGGGLTPSIQEQTWTFTRAQLNSGFGGSGYTLIAAQGSGTFVIVQGSWWYTTGTSTSSGANLHLEARQENQIPGTQTVTKIVGTQFNYMTSQNGGNGMFFRDVPISGLRPYAPNKPTTFHRTSGNQLPSQFTELKLKLQWRVFDSSNI